jgi:hypothetical protein
MRLVRAVVRLYGNCQVYGCINLKASDLGKPRKYTQRNRWCENEILTLE